MHLSNQMFYFLLLSHQVSKDETRFEMLKLNSSKSLELNSPVSYPYDTENLPDSDTS